MFLHSVVLLLLLFCNLWYYTAQNQEARWHIVRFTRVHPPDVKQNTEKPVVDYPCVANYMHTLQIEVTPVNANSNTILNRSGQH